MQRRRTALTVVLPALVLVAAVLMIAGLTIFVQDPTLSQGQSGSYPVTITSTNGYSGSVTLSASNLPQGVTVSFTPNPVSVAPDSPAASTMTVTVSNNAAPATYSIVVTGTGSSGQVIQSSTFTLIITPGVFLSLNPTSGSVSQGNSIETTATVSGAPQTVAMSVSGLPSGASASWAQNPITDSQTGVQDVLIISSSISTPTGVYSVTVTTTGADSQTESSTYTLTVTQAHYTIQFNQDPLPAGVQWCVTLATVAQQCATVSSAGTSSVTFTNLLAGAYGWNVPATVTSNGVEYSASVSSGSATLSSSLFVSETISYSVSAYYLTMSAGSGGTVTPTSEWVSSGSHVTITATPNSGYSFGSWSGSGYSGSSVSATITMNSPITETASFLPMGTVTFSAIFGSSTIGTLLTVDSTSYSSLPQSFSWIAGSSHSFSWSSPVSCGSGCQYVWISASGLSSSSSGSITVPSGGGSVTATYGTSGQPQYYLMMNSGSGGTVSPSSGWYSDGSQVSIQATPVSGYSFAGWSGSGSGSYSGSFASTTITMNGPITESASFSTNTVSLSISPASETIQQGSYTATTATVSGAPQTVTMTFDGLPPGSTAYWVPDELAVDPITIIGSSTTDQLYVSTGSSTPAGTYAITITATGKNGIPVSTSFDLTVQAPYYLTINSEYGSTSGSGWYFPGTIASFSVSPTTVSCGSGCQYVFQGWSGSGSGSYSGTSASTSVTVDNAITETANWQLEYYFTIQTSGLGSSTASAPNGWYNAGTSILLYSVTPSSGWFWDGWTCSGSGCYSGNNEQNQLLTLNAPITETANFLQGGSITFYAYDYFNYGIEVNGNPGYETCFNGNLAGQSYSYCAGTIGTGSYNYNTISDVAPTTYSITPGEGIDGPDAVTAYSESPLPPSSPPPSLPASVTSLTVNPDQTTTEYFYYQDPTTITVSVSSSWWFSVTDTATATLKDIHGDAITYRMVSLIQFVTVTIVDSCAAGIGTQSLSFETNSNGQASFSYSGTAPSWGGCPTASASFVGTPYLGASNSVSGSQVSYSVSLTESGLPSGTTWSVVFNGNSYSTGSSTINIYSVPAGNYPWSTSSVSSSGTTYIPSTSSGTLPVGQCSSTCSTNSQSISFVPNPAVSFAESGLPTGTSWSVTFNGSPYSSTGTTITIPNISPGTYSWSISSNPASCGTGCQGIPSPASGSMNVPSQTSQSISFQTQYQVTIFANPSSDGTVSPSGTQWENAGTSLSISSTPSSSYLFQSWTSSSGSITFSSTTSASTTATINGPGTITGNFQQWSISLSSSAGTSLTIGSSTTLTATASEDVGPTPFEIEIYDTTMSTQIAACGSGTSCTVTVSQSSASTHIYVAYVDSGAGVNIQATSNTMAIAWNPVGVTFTESGLPSGTSWSVTVGTSTQSSTTSSISFTVITMGTSWSVPTVAIGSLCTLTPSPSSGTVTGSGTVSITFGGCSAVTFSESGLPSGVQWWATLNGVTEYSTTTSINFAAINTGTYSWSVMSQYIVSSTNALYQASTSSGSINTATQSAVSITYNEIQTVTLSLNPNPVTMSSGSSATSTLQVSLNAATSVQISMAGIPSGLTVTPTTSSCSSSCSLSISVTDTSAGYGAYSFTITACPNIGTCQSITLNTAIGQMTFSPASPISIGNWQEDAIQITINFVPNVVFSFSFSNSEPDWSIGTQQTCNTGATGSCTITAYAANLNAPDGSTDSVQVTASGSDGLSLGAIYQLIAPDFSCPVVLFSNNAYWNQTGPVPVYAGQTITIDTVYLWICTSGNLGAVTWNFVSNSQSPGYTGSFSPTTSAVNGEVVVTLTFSSSDATGNYVISIEGSTPGGGSYTANIPIEIGYAMNFTSTTLKGGTFSPTGGAYYSGNYPNGNDVGYFWYPTQTNVNACETPYSAWAGEITGTYSTGESTSQQCISVTVGPSQHYAQENFQFFGASNLNLVINTATNPSSANGGTTSPAPGTYSYLAGSTVTNICASNYYDFVFAGWTGSGTGSYTGSSMCISVTLITGITETANFNQLNTVTITESGLPPGTQWSSTFNGVTETNPAPSCVVANFDSSAKLCTNTLYPAEGQQVTLTGSFDGYDYAAGGYNYGIEIFNAAGVELASCVSDSTSCSTTFTYNGIITDYYAEFLYYNGGWGSFNTQANLQIAQYPTTSNSVSFQSIQSGTYSWSVPSAFSCGAGCQYVAQTSSGSITISSSTTITINYIQQYYVSTTSEQLPTNIQLVQTQNCGGTTCTFASPVASGDVILVAGSIWSSGAEPPISCSMSDTRGSSISVGAVAADAQVYGSTEYWTYAVAYVAQLTSSGTETITLTNIPGYYGCSFDIVMYEISGVTTSNIQFTTGGGFGMSYLQYFTTGTLTTAIPSIAIGFAQTVIFGNSIGPGFTQGPNYGLNSEYINGFTGSTDFPFTDTSYDGVYNGYDVAPLSLIGVIIQAVSNGAVSPSNGWFNAGSSVQFTGTNNGNAAFQSWQGSGAGSYSGTANPVSITINAPITETAIFESVYSLSFTQTGLTAGDSWSVTVNGVGTQTSTGSTITFTLPTGTYSYSVSTTLNGCSGTCVYFTSPPSGTVTVPGTTLLPLTGWSLSGGASASSVNGAPAILLDDTGNNPSMTYTLNAQIPSGTTLTLTFDYISPAPFCYYISDGGGNACSIGSSGSWTQDTLTWTTTSAYSSIEVELYGECCGYGNGNIYINNVMLASSPPIVSSGVTIPVYLEREQEQTMTVSSGTGGEASIGAVYSVWDYSSGTYGAYEGSQYVGWGLDGCANSGGSVSSSTVAGMNAVSYAISITANSPSTLGCDTLGGQTVYAGQVIDYWASGNGFNPMCLWTGSACDNGGINVMATQGSWTEYSTTVTATETVAMYIYTAGAGTTEKYQFILSPSITTLPGTSVNIAALPNSGANFGSWSPSGSISVGSSTADPTTATINGAGSVTANFFAYVYFYTSGVSSGITSPALTVNGVNYGYEYPLTLQVPIGSTVTYSFASVAAYSSTLQYAFSSASGTYTTQSGSFTATGQVSVTGSFVTQYYVTLNSAYGTTSGSGWYSYGASDSMSVTSPVSCGTGCEATFTSWSGYYGSSSNPFVYPVYAAYTETANWQVQYYLTVTSPYGSPTGSGWYNSGTSAAFGVTTPISCGTGCQYALSSWSGSGTGSYSGSAASTSVTMSGPITESANWVAQYYLTMSAQAGGSTNPSSEWVNAGTGVGMTATPNSYYAFNGWTGSGSGSYSGGTNPVTITVNGPISESAAFYTTNLAVTFPTQYAARFIFSAGNDWNSISYTGMTPSFEAGYVTQGTGDAGFSFGYSPGSLSLDTTCCNYYPKQEIVDFTVAPGATTLSITMTHGCLGYTSTLEIDALENGVWTEIATFTDPAGCTGGGTDPASFTLPVSDLYVSSALTTNPSGSQAYPYGTVVPIAAQNPFTGAGLVPQWSATSEITIANPNSASTSATVDAAGTVSLSFVTPPGPSAISTSVSGSACSLSVTSGEIIVAMYGNSAGYGLSSPSDNFGDGYSQGAYEGNVRAVAVYYTVASTTGTVSITPGGSGTAYDEMICYAVSGFSTSGLVSSIGSGSTGSTSSVGSFTPATNSLVVSVEINDACGTPSAQSGFTITSGPGTDGYCIASEYSAGWSGGATSASISLGGTAPYWDEAAVSFP